MSQPTSDFTINAAADYRVDFSRYQHRAIVMAVVLLALAGVMAILLDWREVRVAVAEANWRPILAGLGITVGSYFLQGYSFALLNRSFGVRLGLGPLFGVGLVSSAMIAAIGGVAGHSLRLLLMTKRGVPTADAMAPSLFHGYLESLVFFALIPSGLAYIALTHPLSSGLAITVGVGAGVLGVAFAVTAVVFFVGPVRAIALRLFGTVWRWVARRPIERGLQAFDATLRHGLGELRARPSELAIPLALIVVDRLSRLAVVWLCFQALGGQVEPGVVVTGFAIGVAVGVMSMVPGGLGIQEGSMAGVYHLLGVPLEQAALVSLLFRLVYYMIPFGISLLFYWYVLREQSPAQQAT